MSQPSEAPDEFARIARSVQDAWAQAFARGDWAAIAGLYAPDTAFYGSTASLHTNPAGVLSYFEGLPPGFVAAHYATPHITPLSPGLFAASGEVVFVVSVNGRQEDRPYRMSHVFRHTELGWRIALHHASRRPA